MSWLRRSEDLVIAMLDGRRAGELLAHPCGCNGDKPHSLGTHLWDATSDMTPGIKAASYEAQGTSTTGDAEPAPVVDAHDEYKRLVVEWRTTALNLSAFIEKNRPDRHLHVVPTSSDDQWCRACLAAGFCAPRFRDEQLCRWCSEFRLTYRMDPPAELLNMRHDGRRIRQHEVDAAIKAERKRLKAETRKARTSA